MQCACYHLFFSFLQIYACIWVWARMNAQIYEINSRYWTQQYIYIYIYIYWIEFFENENSEITIIILKNKENTCTLGGVLKHLQKINNAGQHFWDQCWLGCIFIAFWCWLECLLIFQEGCFWAGLEHLLGKGSTFLQMGSICQNDLDDMHIFCEANSLY